MERNEVRIESLLTEQNQTIAAIATPRGMGGIGVIRISGPQAHAIACRLNAPPARPRSARYARFYDAQGEVIDDGMILWFPAPRSFTGEDVVELHVHSSPLLIQTLLEQCIRLGARLARAGEFSQRAFLNGKLDLAQAEAIADLIAAADLRAARAARRSLDGRFSNQCHSLADQLTKLRVQIEAQIDFSDEALDGASDARLCDAFQQLLHQFQQLRKHAAQGRRLRDGWHCVLLGPPNAGKSALLNALVGCERAIVTEIAGTTRDLLRERITINDTEMTLVDTAGLRSQTADPIEQEGIRRTHAELLEADLVLVVLDSNQLHTDRSAVADAVAQVSHVLWVYNKSDSLSQPMSLDDDNCVLVSALTGDGIDNLLARIERHIQSVVGEAGEGEFSARLRHIDALERAEAHLSEALQLFRCASLELAAEELRFSHAATGEITGHTYPDDLLGEIFSSFCIGK